MFFCNAAANDDADAEMPMPRFPNGLDKNTFWLLLTNNWIELKEKMEKQGERANIFYY